MSDAYNAKSIALLADALIKHKRLYYEGTPCISDFEYDEMEAKLKQLSPHHPVLMAVGTEESYGEKKVPHDVPMLSLQKVYSVSELLDWQGGRDIVGTWKVDGNSLSLVYRAGALVMAKTRGNGRFGENATDKARWIPDLAPSVAENWDFEIRGELYCSNIRFALLTEEMIARGLERPTNPRNIVAGMLGRKSHIDLSRYLNFLAFEVIFYRTNVDGDRLFSLESEKFSWLREQGFTVPDPEILKSQDELIRYLEKVKSLMAEGDISIDGAVFCHNELAYQNILGHTSHHPRYKMSFKWQGETAVVVIKAISWATSRHGIVTPVAVIEPCQLSGASITNITLHNALHVRTFDLKPGDKIEIVRSGEVIPKFLRVVESQGEGHVWLERCPSCDVELVFDGVRLRCPNTDSCPAQRIGSILNWIRYAEIEDLSEKRLESMIDMHLVSKVSDLYRLSVNDLLKLPLTKEKMATKLYHNIQKSKNVPLFRFFAGLGVAGMGLTSWEKLVSAFPELSKVRQVSVEDLVAIDGFAEKTAEQVVASLKAKSDLIDELLSSGVSPILPLLEGDGQPRVLDGRQIAITGRLSRPRDDIAELIKQAGGKVSSSVSKNTYAVVTGDPHSASTKMEKARGMGVLIWSEDDLLSELRG